MEEKGGYLHIIFIFIGVACLALGVFYYITDNENKERLAENTISNEPTKEQEENNNKEEKKEEVVSNTIKAFDLKDNEAFELSLGNGSKVNLSTNVLDDKKVLLYNGEELITFDDINLVTKYFSYNDNVIIFTYSLADKVGVIYVIDSLKQVEKIEEIDLNNRVMIPSNMELSNNKLVVQGTRLKDNSITLQDGDIDICNDDDLTLHSLRDDSPLKIEYNMNIINKKITFDFVKIDDTLGSAKKLLCTTKE